MKIKFLNIIKILNHFPVTEAECMQAQKEYSYFNFKKINVVVTQKYL